MYPTHLAKEVAAKLNRTVESIYSMVGICGLKKSSDWVDNPKNKTFKKGHTGGWKTWFADGKPAHNKGKKWSDYASKESQEKMRKTTFAKGSTPVNASYDGAIRQRYHSKDKRTYLYIRVAPMKWELLHRYNWIQANGPIPLGHRLTFIDGNTLNCDLSNLRTISTADNMKRNSIHERYPEEIKQTIIKLGHLKRIINGKKQDQ